MKMRSLFLSLGIMALSFGAVVYGINQTNAQGVVAGDYDYSDYSHYGDYGSSDEPEEIIVKETQIVTRQVKLNDTITKDITTTTRFDSDGDGIFNEDDEFPAINNYLIVADENRNGIDDKYEQEQEGGTE